MNRWMEPKPNSKELWQNTNALYILQVSSCPGNGKQSGSLSRSDNKMMKHHSVFWNAAMHTNNASSCLSSRSSVILNLDHFFPLLIWKSSRGKRNNQANPTHLLQTFALMFSAALHTSPLGDSFKRVANLCKLSKLVQTPANPQTCATAKTAQGLMICLHLHCLRQQPNQEGTITPPPTQTPPFCPNTFGHPNWHTHQNCYPRISKHIPALLRV